MGSSTIHREARIAAGDGRNGGVRRRDVLKLGALTAVAASTWVTVPRLEAEAQAAGPEAPGVLRSAFGFAVDIPGFADASKNIREIQIDDLTIDQRETTSGLDVEFRMFAPGQAHFGTARFTVAVTPRATSLRQWLDDCVAGKNIRKNITVTILDARGHAARSYNLIECFPTQWSAVNFDTSSTVQTETLRVKIGRIEFKT